MSVYSKPLQKPLKGGSINGNYANISTINVGVLKGDSLNIEGLFEDGILLNVIIQDSEIRNSVIGNNGQNSAFFINLQTTGDVAFLSNIPGASVSWNPDTGLFYITSDLKVQGCSFLGNIEICNNDISATNLNGDIFIKPKGLGTLYLDGPITNKTTNGSFLTELPKGGASFIINDTFKIFSSHGSALISTFGDQTFTAKNGDISLNVETTRSSLVSSVNMTDGTILITTPINHYLTTGNIINLDNTLISGEFTVGSIISDTQFKITDTTLVTSIASGGNYLKHISNNIILNSQNLIKIPENTKLTFGETCNNISSSTSGIHIKSCNDISLESPSIIKIPQDTKFQLGSSGNNYINFDGNSINIEGTDSITLDSDLLQLNNTNTRFYDPILTIADYTLVTNDNKDRGIEFKYYDNTFGSKLGWFGYKNDTQLFTFISDAINTNEIITGTLGNFELNNLSVSNITLVPGSTIDMNCGRLINTNLITGCGNTLNISGSENVNISASGTISLLGTVFIPTNYQFKFGSQGTLLKDSGGNMSLTAFKNIYLNTETNGNIILPINTKISFDGTTNENIIINSNTSGELVLKTNNNLYLTTTNGNVIIPQNTNIQLGNTTQNISGSNSGIIIKSNSNSSFINIISDSSISISSSFGNILLNSKSGDINLITNTTGNVRINQKLIFNTSGNANNITLNTNDLVITGNTTNNFNINAFSNINLNASSNINIPINTLLNVGNNVIYSDTSNTFNIKNANSNGTLIINGGITTTLNNTGGYLFINNDTTTISVNTLTITGNNTIINTQNTSFKDPILTLGESLLDSKDRGIEYNYGSNLGWFGTKTDNNRFTFYSNAVNAGEVITGTLGDLQAATIYSSNLTFNGISAGNIDMNCGTITNVNTLTGCSGTININASSNINQNSNNIMLNANTKVQIPFGIPLSFGNTNNSFNCDSSGTLVIKTTNGTNGNGTVIFDSNVLINGITTNVNSTVTNILDPIFSIGGITGPIVDDNKDRGIEFKWNSLGSSKTGFFGFKDSLERFVFIKDGTNTNEVFSGNYSDVQFNNIYGNDLFLNTYGSGGNVYGINQLSGGEISIISTSGNINLIPTQGNYVSIPYNVPLIFGNTSNSISSNSSGNLSINSSNNTNINSNQLNLNTISDININENIHVNFGNSNVYFTNSNGNLQIFNSQGNILLTPQNSSGSIDIPVYNHINFGNTSNSIYSNGTNLILNGYQGIDFSSTSITFNGDVNIIGSISATGIEFDFNKYILPLGTYQYLNITNISNVSGTNGNVSITTSVPHNFVVGDQIIVKNSNAVPDIDNLNNTYYTITYIDSNSIFRIEIPSLTFTNDGSSGTIKSNLTTQQNKDVGIQVNYWSSTGNASITSGTIGFNTGFFGFKQNTERWSFYTEATIANDIVSGTFGDIEVNKIFTSKMSGFLLEGSVSCGSNNVNGTNFNIGGGTINSTPIGASSAQSGRFTTLNNTVTASLTDTTLQGIIIYPLTDKYTLSSGGIVYRSPNSSYSVSMFNVSGVNFTSSSGTMPSTSIAEGTIKWLICNGAGFGCKYTVYFGPNKLIAPNSLNDSHIPTKLVFKRKGQSAQLIFDGSSWVLLGGGVYIE